MERGTARRRRSKWRAYANELAVYFLQNVEKGEAMKVARFPDGEALNPARKLYAALRCEFIALGRWEEVEVVTLPARLYVMWKGH